MNKLHHSQLTPRQLAIVLAALEFWMDNAENDLYEDEQHQCEQVTDACFGAQGEPSNEEVQQLCRQLNRFESGVSPDWRKPEPLTPLELQDLAIEAAKSWLTVNGLENVLKNLRDAVSELDPVITDIDIIVATRLAEDLTYKRQQQTVRAENPIFQYLHGRRYELDGIPGWFEHRVYKARFPYERWVHRLSHRPDRQHPKYLEIKAQLGDNWDTDLTDSIETYCGIAIALGYQEPSISPTPIEA